MARAKIPDSVEFEPFTEALEASEEDEFPPYEPLPELPNNCISEMENTAIMPEMDTNWNICPRQLQESGPDEISPEYGLYSSMMNYSTSHTFSESHPPWSPSSFETLAQAQKPSGRALPALALNTRDIPQPPSSRHRHGRTGTLSDEPMSATVISPMSASEGFFSSMRGISGREIQVSPTESEATYNSFLTSDSGYVSATIDSAWSATTMDFDRIWDSGSMKRPSSEVFPMISEVEMGCDAGSMKPTSPHIYVASSSVPSRSSSNSSCHSANRCTAIAKRKAISPHWTDPKSLVESFVEVLNEHLQHSRDALQQLPSNSTIKELLAMSSASIISIGFDVLRGLFEKRNPTAIISIFAFSHVAYAAAIAVDDKSSKVRTEEWFQDSLCWLSGLSSERQRMSYTLVVHAIWKPHELMQMDNGSGFSKFSELARLPSDHENRLVKACRHFLDIQENLSNNDKACSLARSSSFNFSQASFYRIAKSRVINELIQKNSIEAFIEDVVAVEKRLREGSIKNLRQLELELIGAGKVSARPKRSDEG
jgi:hypothetical protein